MIGLPSYGSVAEKCVRIAFDEGIGLFSIIMRLEVRKSTPQPQKSAFNSSRI